MSSRSLRWIPDYCNEGDNYTFTGSEAQTTRNVFDGGVAGMSQAFVSRVAFQLNFANYTAVTVKAQARIASDGNWEDISGATTSADNDIVTFATMGTAGPYAQWRLTVAATDSGSTDSLDITVIEELVS